MLSRQSISINILDDVKLSSQDLLKYAYDLSLVHKVYPKNIEYKHISLGEVRKNIENAYESAKQGKYEGLELPALSEWFYDNRYLFIEQIKQIELKKETYRLPHIRNGRYAHYPRSFALAIELAKHSSFYITVNSIEEFLEAYQREAELDSGELWVFVDMLKISLLCAVSELAKRSMENLKMRKKAEKFYVQAEKETQGLEQLINENRGVLFSPQFIEYTTVLFRESQHMAEVTERINRKLAIRDLSMDKLIKKAHATQATNIMYISNALTSLRMLAKINFESIFEQVSAVHKHLSSDECYLEMEFSSREYYRKGITEIASIINVSEPAVAKAAAKLSERFGEHIGIYIMGHKRHELMKEFGKLPAREKAVGFLKKHMLLMYSGGALISSIISAGLLCISLFFMYPIEYGIIGFIISIIPVYAVAVAINNRIFTLINKPAYIPKMSLKEGIPQECATMVTVTSLLTSLEDGQEMLEKMQVYYAANQQDNLYFVLLSDFKEDKNEITAQEEEIIEKIENEICSLNNKYGKKLFFYAQRKRTYIQSQKIFSGKERKRGALLDMCALLRGDDSGFMHVTKDIPQAIKYVITLDADTELSRDAAIKMIGAMEHPLNRAEIDKATNTVKRGFGVMQPRIGIDVVSAAKTRFSLVFSGKGGLDTYACAASDVYQDGFGTGIYTGKGIFEIDVFLLVLKNAFPDDAILSHDLLEGGYLRCALLSDIVLMDGYPARYLSWAQRQHRWVRGDWQIIPWLRRTVKTKEGRTRNPLSGLTKYQILDNIRRSLVVPLSFIVILLSQTAFYHSAFFWLISGILPLFIDSILDFLTRIIVLIKNAGKGATLKDAWYETKTLFEQSFYKFAFLPYETYLMLDAVMRTIIRMTVTRKNMLEWVTAAEGEKRDKEDVSYYWRKMRAAPILAVVLYALSLIATGTFSVVAFAIFTVWFFAPSIAFIISRPRKVKKYTLDGKQRAYLEDIALRTWRFFEKYGGENEYCWMPDNYQQSPKKGIAPRTSPTNIAYAMTSCIIAYYMGFSTFPDVLGRIEHCIQGIEKAPKWQGHLYNWYDTNDLSPLEPRYVSSVDSGNLACYLIVAYEAINDMLAGPIAGYVQKGIPIVLRESGQPESSVTEDTSSLDTEVLNQGIYESIEMIENMDESGEMHSDLKEAYSVYFDKFAKWAKLLNGFESQHTSLYSDIISELQVKLGLISINRYIEEFNELLEMLSEIYEKAAGLSDAKALEWVKSMETAFGECYVAARRLSLRAERLNRRIMALFDGMDFTVLYDEGKGLFSIGFDIRQNKLSDTHYDLLASEARQTGFIAIAKGDVPGKHWFRLSRPLTVAGDNRVLLSWGGTMFEYLMPLIIMRSYDNTLLGETYKTVVNMQSNYGEQRHVPWGVSESGYYAFDLNMNYQYKAFGVPGLGMRSGLVREIVVSPYSVFLALHVNAKAAVHNLQKLEKIGALGKYGFFEAIDYTQARMQKGKKKRIIKSYMAHHQGMILASILNCLQDDKLQRLFHSSMCVRATEMLLKEKVPPRNITLSLGEKQPERQEFAEEIHSVRTFKHFVQYPEAHFLSNGNYTVMLTQYGTGYSMYRYKMISRWYSDFLRTAPGIHIYIKDTDNGAVWSATLLPTCVRSDQERAVFEPHKVSYVREIGDIETTLEVCVSPECDMEVRNLEINNKGDKQANLAVFCAYTPALCSQPDFEAHPAFAELFVETEAEASGNTIYVRRRNKNMYSAIKACASGNIELVTDRAGIFGRKIIFGVPSYLANDQSGRDVARAAGIRCSTAIPAKSICSVSFAIAAGESKQDVMQCLSGISGEEDIKRVFHLAWTHSQVEMRYLKLKDMQADLFQRIASRVVIKIPFERPSNAEADGVKTLWKMGISGDIPIICMYAHDTEHIDVVKTVAKAQEFMSHRCIKADLAVIYDGGAEYINPLRDKINELVQAASNRPYNKIYAVSRDAAPEEDIATIINASCLVLNDSSPLLEQLKVHIKMNAFEIFERETLRERIRIPKRLKAFDNGTGGFISNGTEYCIDVEDKPPLPWSNILVNKSFGTLISAGGGGYTWVENAQMKRLTPFRNDPLTDINAEGILVRNDRTGTVFSIMPDTYASGRYRVIHGIGYTLSERFGGISTNAKFFVDTSLPVKASILEIQNNTSKSGEYSVYCFAEPGIARGCRSITARFNKNRLEASSPFDDKQRTMFIAMPQQNANYTSSEFEFFGSPGNNILPEAVKVKELSNYAGAASLLALQTHIMLTPGEKKSAVILLGYAGGQQADEIINEYGSPEKAEEKLLKTKEYWKGLTGSISVTTSNKSFDTLVNNWLLYQTYASRIWGRTGYYQSGGAYGFRDQLQDVLALVYTDPAITRQFILKFATRQFKEGDVMHWWHEPAQGVRTRVSDDKLFLPFVACEYERVTGDMSVFDEVVPYLEGKEIPEGVHDIYENFFAGDIKENIFSHCVKAIDSALKFGEHGLPLIGTGDWNDGMNKIGEKGLGESVWLAFFLSEVLRIFIALCRKRNEDSLAQAYEEKRNELRANIEKHAWDGEWYMRAFFDDGTPVGSHDSPECKIDLVSQAWAVFAGAARARKAFCSAEEHLVMQEESVIRLLTPAFDKWEKDPGYIKSYIPGVRENGGQYSHAAVWFVIAAAKLREKEKALKLFQMLNPINHTRTPAGVAKYKGEPYVMAADVYYSDEYRGRAGWTWYTGTSGWMYQAAIIYILGIRIDNGELSIYPCVPDNFGAYKVEYKKGGAVYVINVDIAPGYEGAALLTFDGEETGKMVRLDRTEGVHKINACWKQ